MGAIWRTAKSSTQLRAFGFAVSCLVGGIGAAMAQGVGRGVAGPGAVQFAPHRAVYDVVLDRSSPGSGVTEMTGRMVYELTGSVCEGYTQNMRFVTRTGGQEGSIRVSDMRTSSWEDAGGRRLRFSNAQYQDEILAETAQGDAGREKGQVRVDLSKPAKKTLTLGGDVYFPIQHSVALIEAARAKRTLLKADVYDGGEKGEKVYQTSAIIGRAEGAAKLPPDLKNADRLAKLLSWPISIGYFEPGSEKKDAVPSYELGFRFYENGVTSTLRIDYGDFAIRGEIKELQFLEPSKCPQ